MQTYNKVLKGAVIYGANSSGKSNLIKAMSTMRRIVFQSFEKTLTDVEIAPLLALLNETIARIPGAQLR